jgi:hypothetical protein
MLEMEQNLIQSATIKQPIIENAVYEREEAIAITGFSLSTLIRAEKSGELKGRNIGRRRYYLGADLLKWLQGEHRSPCNPMVSLRVIELYGLPSTSIHRIAPRFLEPQHKRRGAHSVCGESDPQQFSGRISDESRNRHG